MAEFSKRSYKKELLDQEGIPFEDIRQNMIELDFINLRLGGHNVTIQAFKAILKKIKKDLHENISILEIGCGGGDNLREIKKYCAAKSINASFTGVDINPNCVQFAKSKKENEGIDFIESDYKKLMLPVKPDIIFSSLFCHHFNDDNVVSILKWKKENSALGFFVNDLHRHPFAYYSIKWLTALFSKSYLVKNDAPLSVLRGFKKTELTKFIHESCTHNANLKWKWAFRWMIVYSHE